MWPDFYYSQEDLPKDFNIKNKSIDNYKNLFSSYKYNFPSLEDALHQMYKSQNIYAQMRFDVCYIKWYKICCKPNREGCGFD